MRQLFIWKLTFRAQAQKLKEQGDENYARHKREVAAEVSGDGSAIGVSVSGGEFHVDFPGSYEPYTVTVCGLDGTVLASVSGNGGSGTVNISCPVAQGRFCVLRAVQGDNVSVRKFFIK